MGVIRLLMFVVWTIGVAAAGAYVALAPLAEEVTIDTPRCDKVVVHHFARS